MKSRLCGGCRSGGRVRAGRRGRNGADSFTHSRSWIESPNGTLPMSILAPVVRPPPMYSWSRVSSSMVLQPSAMVFLLVIPAATNMMLAPMVPPLVVFAEVMFATTVLAMMSPLMMLSMAASMVS